MDDPNITMEEYIRLEEEKAQRRGETFNWQTATFCRTRHCYKEERFPNFEEEFSAIIFRKINGNSFDSKQGGITNEYDDEREDFETEFRAIVFNKTSDTTAQCEPTISPHNENQIDFRISLDESDDKDYTIVYDENSISYKIIFVNKTDSKNDNDKVSMPLYLTPEPEVSYSNDLDFFKDFEKEFPAIVYNDALTSKSDSLTKTIVCPQRINEFDLKDDTSLSKYNEKEQNVLYFNDLFPFKVIYPDDSKSDSDIDNDEIDIEQPSRDMTIIPSTNIININKQWSNNLFETSHDTSS
ncbi:hypothetical protein Tco_0178113 [Tanacetum coccineum]